MLQAMFVMDRSHYLPIPFYKCLTVIQSFVYIEKRMTFCTTEEKILDQEFFQDNIKCGFGIKIENEEWLFEMMKRMLVEFSH